jgi:squalene synthase HpnC
MSTRQPYTVDAEQLRAADRHCARLLRHYENFTVASRLTPRSLRRDLTRVYAFCRTTDDLGDEMGDGDRALASLERWRYQVESMFDGAKPQHPVLIALSDTVRRRDLSREPFLDLITANEQDQHVHKYADWSALHGYCVHSAAPVGRMVLALFGITDPRAMALSDDVCIGLQLVNFVQDVSVDAARGRTYLLRSEMRPGIVDAARAMAYRAQQLLSSGRQLERMVPLRLRLQLALYRCGGEAVLRRIAAMGYDTTQSRPHLSAADRVRVLLDAAGAACSVSLRPAPRSEASSG